MAPVLIPVAVAAAGAGVGVALGVTTVAAAAVSVGVAAVAAGVGYLTAPKPSAPVAVSTGALIPPREVAAPANEQRDIAVRQAAPARRFVYGKVRAGGVVFFQDNVNPYMLVGTAISDGVIEAIDKVFFGATEIPLDSSGAAAVGSIYYGNFTLERRLGLSTQAADTLLLGAFPSLTSNFRQRGVACAGSRLHWGADSASHSALWSGSTTPVFQVRGVHVYDPRDGAQSAGTPSTWTYSTSPPLAVAHALISAWGVALSADDIDWTSFGACATACATTLTYNSETVATFELGGVFQAGHDLASQVTDMLASFGGTLIDVDGKIGCAMDGARSSVWTITDADVIEIGEFVHAGDFGQTFNAIKAKFFDSNSDGAEVTTPVYQISAAVASEGLRETSLDLRFTARSHSAQILAFRELHRSRAGKRLSLTLSDAALYLQELDRVTIAFVDAPFMNGDYEVEQVDLAPYGAIVQLREYASAAYADPATYLV